ncbi:MAG: hypothetical protein V3U02_06610 [Calditrichia bacterium]
MHTRTFDGLTYRWYNAYKSKPRAKGVADDLRKIERYARVVYSPQWGWAVWWRYKDETSWYQRRRK